MPLLSLPAPTSDLKTHPLARLTSYNSEASSSATSGVNSEGFCTTALPATKAASASVAGIENG